MATVLVQFVMRQEIDLAEKSYEMFPSAQTISISYPAKIQFEVEGKIELLECNGYPLASAEYLTDIDIQDSKQIYDGCRKYEEITLRATNRLIEWYRYHTRRYNIRTVVLSQVEPIFITFTAEGETRVERREHILAQPSDFINFADIINAQFNNDLRKSEGPPLEEMLILDAQDLFSEHRYRESVMMAWCAIEFVFDPFIRSKLRERFPYITEEALQNFERDLHFAHRADYLFHLLTGYSFRDAPDGFWERFCTSRRRRNDVIHRGEMAQKNDAQDAVWAAEHLIQKLRI